MRGRKTSMAAIRIIEEAHVRPTRRSESTQKLELTPCDLQLLNLDYIQKGLIYDTKPEDGFVVHLKSALSRVLDCFHPFAGRFAIVQHGEGSASFSIDCNDAGVLFIHAAADGVAVADILDAVYTPTVVDSFFALNAVLNREGTSKALLAIQVTELADGVFVGCSMNHSVADGKTYWHFLNAWSELSFASSRDTITPRQPVFDRFFQFHRDGEPVYPIRIPFPDASATRFVPPAPLCDRVFRFRREKIALLKARAAAEAAVTVRFSSLQVILAHVWRAVVRAWRVIPEEETIYRVMVGMRPRLQLPEEYFGNAILTGTVTARAGELLRQGLGFAALRINEMVRLQTREKAERFLEEWVEAPKIISIGKLMTTNTLITGSSPLFDVYGNDFGWGRPVGLRSGMGNKYEGKMTVFPGAEEGSVDIEASLLPETQEALGCDPVFMEAFAV